jgi:LysR family transcriptional regulator, nitrogen assimilation regulatory protein
MNFKALRYFVAIADAGSLTAAAQVLRIAQPALTRQLRELEEELDTTLLIRSSKGVRLTQSGVTLYESAQKILIEVHKARQRLVAKKGATPTELVLGTSPTLARLLLPGVFSLVERAQTDIRLRAREAFTPTLLEWLAKGVIDVAVVTNPEPHRAFAYQPLLGEPFVLVSNAQLEVPPIVSVKQMARMRMLITSLHRGIVERQLAPLGGTLNIWAEIDSIDAIKELVQTQPLATISPISVYKSQNLSGAVRISEISGVQLNRLLVLASRIEQQDSPALVMLRETIEAEFGRLQRQGLFSLQASA